MTKRREERYKGKEKREEDKCFTGVEEATRERQRMLDKEPYS